MRVQLLFGITAFKIVLAMPVNPSQDDQEVAEHTIVNARDFGHDQAIELSGMQPNGASSDEVQQPNFMQAPSQEPAPTRSAIEDLRIDYENKDNWCHWISPYRNRVYRVWEQADPLIDSDWDLNSKTTGVLVHLYLQSRFLRDHLYQEPACIGSALACGTGLIYPTAASGCSMPVGVTSTVGGYCAVFGSIWSGVFGGACLCGACCGVAFLPDYIQRRNFLLQMHDVIKSAVMDKLQPDLAREVAKIKYSLFEGGKELRQLAELFEAHGLPEASRYIRDLPDFYISMSVYRGGHPALQKNGQDCAICLDAMDQRPYHEIVAATPPGEPRPKPRRFAQLECSHEFHFKCLDEALRKSGPKCPLCRQNVLP